MVRANGHFVLQYTANNPGVWPFHCHIAWHVSGGLYATFLERPKGIMKMTVIPATIAETCTAWDLYTSSNEPDQYDSGV